MNKNLTRFATGGLALLVLLSSPFSTVRATDGDREGSSQGIYQTLLLDDSQESDLESGEDMDITDPVNPEAQSSPQKKDSGKSGEKTEEKKNKPNPLHPTNPQAIRSFSTNKSGQLSSAWSLERSREPGRVNTKREEYKNPKGQVVKKDNAYTYQEGSRTRLARNAWVKLGGKSYFADPNGNLYTNTLLEVEGKTYYFGPQAYSLSGIVNVNGKSYYFDGENNNAMIREARTLTRGGTTYIIDSDFTVSKDEHISSGQETDHQGELELIPKYNDDGGMLVIDISKYQRPADIDYDLLCQNITGVILRVAHSWQNREVLAPNEDPTFATHYKEFRKRGIPVGCYYFSTAVTYDEGVQEAIKTMEILGNRKLQLPVYWDTEDEYKQRKIPRDQLTQAGKGFLETLANRGYVVGVYASSSWLKHHLNMEELQDYETWVAHYGRTRDGKSVKIQRPNYNRSYQIWQFESRGRVPGYKYNLDVNWMYKDYPKMIGNHPK